ncbi:MAG: TolC family protein [Saprospiraceae bacterium]|nr:TolC family protein [Saprospiraceae bacterium]
MKIVLFVLGLTLLVVSKGLSGDTLTVQQCRELAVRNSPLQQKKLYAESIAALQIRNLQSNSLPRIHIGAQASWQSDVFRFPVENPLFAVPDIPKDQYRLSVDVAQRIWDGGADHYARRQRDLERDLAAAQVEVDVFQLREVVTDLYFKTLLLQENAAVLDLSKSELAARLRQAEAAVTEGAALRTTADQVKIQLLRTEQQIAELQVDKQTLMEILAKWVGRENTDFQLAAPLWSEMPLNIEKRPEHRLFTLQQSMFQLQKDRLNLSLQPRIEAFAQGGFGRPNPFNFFETGFEPFALVGLRATWTPFDWGTRKRDAQVLDLQIKTVEAQRLAFDQRLEASTIKDFWDLNVKYREQLEKDEAIVRLQEDIVSRADAQVKNGVMTATDYLTQLNLLTQARLLRKTHELQAAQAREMLAAKLGN